MKTCTKCQQPRPEEAFFIKSKKTGQRKTICHDCEKEYKNRHYHKNKDHYMERARAAQKLYRASLREMVLNYLAEHPCSVCGESDVDVLDFHHRNPEEKDFSIATASAKGLTEVQVIEEIKKCDVLCANDHRRLHARLRRGRSG